MDEKEDKQTNDHSDARDKQEAIEVIKQANAAAERLERANSEAARREAFKRIGGSSEGGQQVVVKTAEQIETEKRIKEYGDATGAQWAKEMHA